MCVQHLFDIETLMHGYEQDINQIFFFCFNFIFIWLSDISQKCDFIR